MSRNLCNGSTCYFCHGEVRKVGPVHPITQDECGVYFDEYQGMLVADAACVDCEAPYLAWLDGTHVKRRGYASVYPEPRTEEDGSLAIQDLSHRSSFNDEPGTADYPKWVMVRQRGSAWPICTLCGAPLRRPGGDCDRSYEHRATEQQGKASE